MLDFKTIDINDKQWITPILTAANISSSHQSFINIFAWAKIYSFQIARLKEFLVVKGKTHDEGPFYYYPAGQGDLKSVLEEMKQDALDLGHEFIIFGLSTENIDEMNRLFPGSFEFKESRDNFDYVYLLEKLVSLSGKKLHAKRNYINRFTQKNNWSFEQITDENLPECWEMNVEWCKAHDCRDDEQLENEDCAVRRCFYYFRELGLEGGLIRSDGRVIAFTMGGKLNSNTYDIHIEKAFGEIEGSYQMINREFAAFIQKNHPEVIYINREEDMGYEGLRKAKLSYYPVKMEEKYLAQYIHE